MKPNLFFAIYWNSEKQKRTYETVPLNIVIEKQKQELPSVPQTNENSENLLFYLSPNDLVYVPTEEEINNPGSIDFHNLTKEQIDRIYRVNNFSGTCYFSPISHARAIASKEVDMKFDDKKKKIIGSYDDKTASIENSQMKFGDKKKKNIQIKDICWKLEINRLGNIKKIIK